MACSTNTELTVALAEAKEAYHALMTGVKPRVVVDSNGERVEFVAANSQKLYLYIQDLERQIGVDAGVVHNSGPASFIF